jgi:hypothetical protein
MSDSGQQQLQPTRCRPWCSILRRRPKAPNAPKVLVTQPSVDHSVDCTDQHNQSDDENSILAKFAAAELSGDLCKSSSSAQIDPARRFRRRDVKRSRRTHTSMMVIASYTHSVRARSPAGRLFIADRIAAAARVF